jgi:nicotinate-nucleotide adenylyltransferase
LKTSSAFPLASPEQRIGLFGGSFDPIHYGHLCLALDMLEAHQLDAVWFCPAYHNPLRELEPSASSRHRDAMIRHAIASIPQLHIVTYELERSIPSYTVDTLRALTAIADASVRFFLILGADSADTFLEWRSPGEIVQLATPLVGCRSSTQAIQTISHWYETSTDPIATAICAGLTPTRHIDISSSEIRQRQRHHRHIEHLTPAWSYIRRHNLYLGNISQ